MLDRSSVFFEKWNPDSSEVSLLRNGSICRKMWNSQFENAIFPLHPSFKVETWVGDVNRMRVLSSKEMHVRNAQLFP
jgi:hypothetical protein